MASRTVSVPRKINGQAMRKGHGVPPKVDLKIAIRNFGPISEGTINLKPLTIFIGPNNSGKSYAATLIHSILSSENMSFPAPNANAADLRGTLWNIIQHYASKVGEHIVKNKGKNSFFMPVSLTKEITEHIIQHMFKRNLEVSIAGNFGSSMKDLVMTGSKSAGIRVGGTAGFDMSISRKLSIRRATGKGEKYRVVFLDNMFDPGDDDAIMVPIGGTRAGLAALSRYILEELAFRIVGKFRNETIPAESFYFPAGRSGMLQGYRVISASVIERARFAGNGSAHTPKLTGVVSDFISDILVLDKQPGHFYRLARDMESELLGGVIRVEISGYMPPEIFYRTKGYVIPLHKTSSTISEIAPILLYLKYIVSPGSMLVIEEPEAHLHPENQLIFAKYIVRMIRAGLNVLVTTHSSILLAEFGKYMRSSKLAYKDRRRLKLYSNDYLEFDEVSPCVFKNKGDKQHVIKRIKTNMEDGISHVEFVNIIEHLYDDELKFQEILER